jgi:CTP:molybdopterin cytidylyltransferase MocA
MNKVYLSQQAHSALTSLPEEDRLLVGKALLQLERNPAGGMKLWGNNDLYLLQAADNIDIIYRFEPSQIQVLAIKGTELLPSHHIRIAAVILAAGKTSTPLPLSNVATSLLDAGIDDMAIVAGDQYEQVRQELKDQNVKIIVNPEYRYGISRSLRSGLKIITGNTQAVMIALGNRPYISPELVRQLIRTYKTQKAPIVAPVYADIRAHPVMFDARFIPELLKTKGNSGGRIVLRRHQQEIAQVEVNDAGILKAIK